jgi:TrpR-related protein YerC/YecD
MLLERPDEWRSAAAEDLLDAIVALPDREEAARFLRDLCTLRELQEMAQRWAIVRLLDEGRHYGEIARETGASTATITRIASWLKHGTGGYRAALERATAQSADRGSVPVSRG